MLASYAYVYIAIGWIDHILLAMGLFVVPFAYVVWTGEGNKGVYVTWGLWFASTLVHAICLPALGRIHELAHGEIPDVAPGIALGVALVAGLLGWIPGGLISSLALAVRHMGKFVGSRLLIRGNKGVSAENTH